MNSVSLVGRVISEPEIKFLDGGSQVASCRISVNRNNGKKDSQGYPESDIFPIEVWGKSAEALTNHIKKGDGIAVTGRVELRRADGEKAGFWVTIKDCRWSFLPKAGGSGSGSSSSSSAPQADDDF